jgi:hypothetical protein
MKSPFSFAVVAAVVVALLFMGALGYRPVEFEQAAQVAASSAGATMSFSTHQEIYRSDGRFLLTGSRLKPTPLVSLSNEVSLRPASAHALAASGLWEAFK